jgi:non-ribosomal peptide synthetase component F
VGGADTPIGERLGRVARANAAAEAIVDGARRLTYGELLDRADSLAGDLRRCGIGPRHLVAVALPRSAELVLAVLGIARAGAGYVPVDLAHPPGRRSQILTDAHPRLVVTDGCSIEGVPAGHECLSFSTATATAAVPDPAPVLEPTDPAYVIYTSGSTGRPNGVCVTQHNAARLFTTTEALFGFGAEDV